MILTEEQRTLRWQIEIVAYMGIHSIEYFDGVTGNGGEFWKFTQNCYGERGCYLWCQLFNSYYKDPTHYRNLFDNDALAHLDPSLSLDNVKARLVDCTGLTEKEYVSFREVVVNFRNKYSAHRQFDSKVIVFPDLGRAISMFHELRAILLESIEAEMKCGYDQDLEDFKNYYESHSRVDVQRKCRNNVSKIKFFD